MDHIYGEVPEKISEVLERVQQSGHHLLDLINDVLDISKMEAGQLTLALSDYSCHIKHILAADVKHIMAPQQQYARGARGASGGQMGVGVGCYAKPTQGGLVRPVAKICFMRRPLYALCDKSLAEVVQTVCSAVESLAVEKGLVLTVALPPDLPLGKGDERRLA